MPEYRIMTFEDYEAVYDLWIQCGNGLNDKEAYYKESGHQRRK